LALIKSISGIRGTIGGTTGDNLTPLDVVKFAAAYGSWVLEKGINKKVVVGRDGRISGSIVQQLVVNTLLSLGIDVVDIGLSTTPTVELAVTWEKAAGGIILTASHNPKEWNALKLLNKDGEFISAEEGTIVLDRAQKANFPFAHVDKLGSYSVNTTCLHKHIEAVVGYPLDASQLVPAKTNSASGTINAVYNQTTRVISYTINFSGLSGKPTSIRVHGPAPAGYNSLPVQVFSSGLPSATDGTYSNTLLVDGVYVKEEDVLRGAYYVTIYTAGNPTSGTGEIRGQLLFE